jgi:hypothetical protein
MASDSISRISSSQRTPALVGDRPHQNSSQQFGSGFPTSGPVPEQEARATDASDFSELDPLICSILALLNPVACTQVAGHVKRILRK